MNNVVKDTIEILRRSSWIHFPEQRVINKEKKQSVWYFPVLERITFYDHMSLHPLPILGSSHFRMYMYIVHQYEYVK